MNKKFLKQLIANYPLNNFTEDGTNTKRHQILGTIYRLLSYKRHYQKLDKPIVTNNMQKTFKVKSLTSRTKRAVIYNGSASNCIFLHKSTIIEEPDGESTGSTVG